MALFRWVVNVKTGERQQVELTLQEEAARRDFIADEARKSAQQQVQHAEEARKQDYLRQLAEKLAADPTILDRIK